MPKNKVSDPITDQEMAFARLVLAGTLTDRHAAEAVGLNPDSAAYTKSKPRVHAYMLEHRAAVQQQIGQQEAADVHRQNLNREQVLARLWELANLSPEMTRNSISGQVKAISMIVAMENLIPDHRAASAANKPAPAPAQTYAAAWRPAKQAIDPQPSPVSAHEEEEPEVPEPKPTPGSAGPPDPVDIGPSQPTSGNRFIPSEPPPPTVPLFTSVPDLRVPFSIKKNPFNPFVHPR